LRLLKSKVFSLFILFVSSPLWAKLPQTYPTAATTQIRWDSYDDSLFTMANSSWSIHCSTWTNLNYNLVWISTGQTVQIWSPIFDSSNTYVGASSSTIDLDSFMNQIVKRTRIHEIFHIANDDMQEYMVWPDTITFPSNWDGWCNEIINNRSVAVACPR
jgi:hypothetical protein